MKYETITSITIALVMLCIIAGVLMLVLSALNHDVESYEKKCSRVSIDDKTDNCMCPCDRPDWIEAMMKISDTCDGWIVKKGEPCVKWGG